MANDPQCTICKVVYLNVGRLCKHAFSSEASFLLNKAQALQGKRNKRNTVSSFLFGILRKNVADDMFFGAPEHRVAWGETDERKKGHKKFQYPCPTCGKSFSTSRARERHTFSNDKCCSMNAAKFDCEICTKSFTERDLMVTHQTWCEYKKRIRVLSGEVEEEEDGEPTSKKRKSTEESRKTIKTYRCDHGSGCVVGCVSESELAIHKACHMDDTVRLKCCYCDHKTATNVSWFPLKEHIIALHPGYITPKYICHVCGDDRGFAKKSKYEKHMTTHSEGKPYQCAECGSTFKQETGLRTHVILEHGSEEAREIMLARNVLKKKAESEKELKLLLCYVCGYTTKSRSYFTVHMNIHKGIKPYSCSQCDYKTVDSACFRRHLWRHKPHKPYKCPFCNFDGIQRAQVLTHMKTKHSVVPEDASKLISHISGKKAKNWKPPLSEPVVSAEPALEAIPTGSVSIVNPDGTETTIPVVEMLAQATDSLNPGGNIQLTYGDLMVNYTLERPEDQPINQ